MTSKEAVTELYKERDNIGKCLIQIEDRRN